MYVVGGLLVVLALIGFLYIDISGNGLRNYEEIRNGANPLQEDTDNDRISDYDEIVNYDTDPARNDTDNDGLTDYEEIELYDTDPNKQDTIGNGLTDYEEVEKYGTDPLSFDTDSDGLTDYEEVKLHATNPTSEDTDNDGLTDYEEVKQYSSNPIKSDTDGDGLNDSAEINIHFTDPTKEDTLGNNLTDYEEVEVYGTDPLKEDTDGDGLTDYDEIKKYDTDPLSRDTTGDGLGDYEQVVTYNTDPAVNDTDDDGLTDYEEIEVYGSDPTETDSNGDGLTDLQNVNLGTDPVKLDSSGDGFLDVYAARNPYIDPRNKSILVQVSYMEGVDIPEDELDKIESEFEDAPNANFSLEFIVDDEPIERKPEVTVSEYYTDYYNDDSVFDRRGEGYYHILAVPEIDESDIEGTNVIFGATTSRSDGILIQERRNDQIFAMTFAHELGHQLGLEKDLFDGIDSRSYDADEYPSSMNYNWSVCIRTSSCDEDYIYTYSRGLGFDDWDFISENFSEHQPSKINLNCESEISCVG